MTTFQSIVLTGASRGIGRALAMRLARPGTRLCLIARNLDGLSETADACRTRGAVVETHSVDVADRPALSQAVLAFDATNPVDLVIANAGISAGLEPGRQPEADGVTTRINAINFLGAVNTVEPLLAPMIDRGQGQIAFVCSLAALRPQPDLPSYSASKAGLRAYGIALRGALRETGVDVTVVSPGFVTSDMSARHHGLKPFEVSADRAAEIIAKGLECRKAHVTFPWQLASLIWLSNRLPPRLSDRFVQGFKSWIEPDD
ncbi:MAG: SDR family NAD(P)-dependent oxidoreductase [Pseudomonadota bacterium]